MFLHEEQLSGNISYRLIQYPSKLDLPYKAGDLYIFLFEKGNGYMQIDEEEQEISNGKVIVIFPGQVISYDILAGTHAHVLIAKKHIYEIVSSIRHIFVGTLKPISAFDISSDIFDLLVFDSLEIKRLLAIDEEDVDELLINRLRAIYLILKLNCMKVRDLTALQDTHPMITRFVELVDLHFHKNKDVSFYAALLNMHSNYLNILCEKVLLKSAKQVIKDRIVKEAKKLMLNTDENIKEIGYILGLRDASHFTLFIKKETGFLPKDFLKLRKKGTKNY